MPCGVIASAVAAARSPQIFSQEDRKIGRFLGLVPRRAHHDATESVADRYALVTRPTYDDCSSLIIGACIEVHRQLGPGLLESIYEECLCRELTAQGLSFERQKPVQVSYKGEFLEQSYRIDLIVEGMVLVEIKAVDAVLPIHAAQVVTYLRVTGIDHGLLVNFNAMTIRADLRSLSRTPKPFRSSDLPVKKSGS